MKKIFLQKKQQSKETSNKKGDIL